MKFSFSSLIFADRKLIHDVKPQGEFLLYCVMFKIYCITVFRWPRCSRLVSSLFHPMLGCLSEMRGNKLHVWQARTVPTRCFYWGPSAAVVRPIQRGELAISERSIFSQTTRAYYAKNRKQHFHYDCWKVATEWKTGINPSDRWGCEN